MSLIRGYDAGHRDDEMKTTSMRFLMLALFLLSLPFLGITSFLVHDENMAIDKLEKEQSGILYHRALFDLLSAARNYRAAVFFDGDKPEARAHLLELKETMLARIQAVEAVDHKLGMDLEIHDDWRRGKVGLQDGFEAPGDGSRFTTLKVQSLAIDALNTMMLRIGQTSGLLLDGEEEPYYMADIMLNVLPFATEYSSYISLHAHHLKSIQFAGDRDDYELMARLVKLRTLKDHYLQSMKIIVLTDTENVSRNIENQLKIENNLNSVINLTNSIISERAFDSQTLRFVVEHAVGAQEQAYAVLSGHLHWHLEEQIDEHVWNRLGIIAAASLSLLIAMSAFLYAYRNANRIKEFESAQRMRAVLDAVGEGIITINEQGVVEGFNPSAQRLFGYHSAEVVGQPLTLLIPDADLSELAGTPSDDLKPDAVSISGHGREAAGRRKDGSAFPIELGMSDFTAEGRRTFVASVRDVTERKRAEAVFNVYAEKMRQTSADLETAQQKATRAEHLSSEILAVIDKEIRTPMHGVIGMTELLSESELPAPQKEQVRTLMGAVRTVFSIFNNMIDFSKLEAGAVRLRATPFDLQSLIEEVLDNLTPRAQAKGLGLDLHYATGASRRFVGDANRILQIVSILVGNAIKFTDRGSVAIKVEEIDRREDRDNMAMLKISVEDSGVGISLTAQTKLFQKLWRHDSSSMPASGGAALGLAICRKLAELMKGEIGVMSEEGVGSTFWFTMQLPRQRDLASDQRDADIEGGNRSVA